MKQALILIDGLGNCVMILRLDEIEAIEFNYLESQCPSGDIWLKKNNKHSIPDRIVLNSKGVKIVTDYFKKGLNRNGSDLLLQQDHEFKAYKGNKLLDLGYESKVCLIHGECCLGHED